MVDLLHMLPVAIISVLDKYVLDNDYLFIDCHADKYTPDFRKFIVVGY